MSNESHHQPAHSGSEHGTTPSYVIGFLISLAFTIIPYYLVVQKSVTGNTLLATILGFAVLQLLIQLLFFLHLGREPRPRWNLLFFISTISIVMVVIIGSLWIMHHLNYNMMSQDVETYIQNTEGIHH